MLQGGGFEGVRRHTNNTVAGGGKALYEARVCINGTTHTLTSPKACIEAAVLYDEACEYLNGSRPNERRSERVHMYRSKMPSFELQRVRDQIDAVLLQEENDAPEASCASGGDGGIVHDDFEDATKDSMAVAMVKHEDRHCNDNNVSAEAAAATLPAGVEANSGDASSLADRQANGNKRKGDAINCGRYTKAHRSTTVKTRFPGVTYNSSMTQATGRLKVPGQSGKLRQVSFPDAVSAAAALDAARIACGNNAEHDNTHSQVRKRRIELQNGSDEHSSRFRNFVQRFYSSLPLAQRPRVLEELNAFEGGNDEQHMCYEYEQGSIGHNRQQEDQAGRNKNPPPLQEEHADGYASTQQTDWYRDNEANRCVKNIHEPMTIATEPLGLRRKGDTFHEEATIGARERAATTTTTDTMEETSVRELLEKLPVSKEEMDQMQQTLEENGLDTIRQLNKTLYELEACKRERSNRHQALSLLGIEAKHLRSWILLQLELSTP